MASCSSERAGGLLQRNCSLRFLILHHVRSFLDSSVFMSLPVASALALIILLRLAKRTSLLESSPVLHSFLLPTLGSKPRRFSVDLPTPIACLHSCRTLLRKKDRFPLLWSSLPALAGALAAEWFRVSALFGPWPSFVYAAASACYGRPWSPCLHLPDAALARVLRPMGPRLVLHLAGARVLASVGRFLVCWLPRLLFDGVSTEAVIGLMSQCWHSMRRPKLAISQRWLDASQDQDPRQSRWT